MSSDFEFYCLSFQNPSRKERMSDIFQKLGIADITHFSDGVSHDDPRLVNSDNRNAWSCMYGHLDMISDFYSNTTKPYGIFCEDDIHIHKDLNAILPSIATDFEAAHLDVLLLGYLATFNAGNITLPGFELIPIQYQSDYRFHNYNHPSIDIWGTQMYMLSREHAKRILDRYDYDSGYAERSLQDRSMVHFSADWTITKDGRRAIITPLLSVESYDYSKPYEYGPQDNFHRRSHEVHYDTSVHL